MTDAPANKMYIASFSSKTRGIVDVYFGYDDSTVSAIYTHSSDPGIVGTLGTKDLKRFDPLQFPDWIKKGGGRFLYTAWCNKELVGVFWIGGEPFPKTHFPDALLEPEYTAAWRTGYSTPEGGTYEGEGIGKRLALAGIADAAERTRNLPTEGAGLSPLERTGIWIDTGGQNLRAQALYAHLGNTMPGQEPIGFDKIGSYEIDDAEQRVGMVASPETIKKLVAISSDFVDFKTK